MDPPQGKMHRLLVQGMSLLKMSADPALQFFFRDPLYFKLWQHFSQEIFASGCRKFLSFGKLNINEWEVPILTAKPSAERARQEQLLNWIDADIHFLFVDTKKCPTSNPWRSGREVVG